MIDRVWWGMTGMNAYGAILGAILHSPFLLCWHLLWLGISIYVVQKLEAGNGK